MPVVLVRLDVYVRGQIIEKVMVKNARDLQQKLAVDGVAVEYVIDIRPVTVQLPGKPRHRAIARLSVENLFYEISYMYASLRSRKIDFSAVQNHGWKKTKAWPADSTLEAVCGVRGYVLMSEFSCRL